MARYLATVGEATEVPRRSPGRGPPYWKSRVLRLKVLGDEHEGGGRGRGDASRDSLRRTSASGGAIAWSADGRRLVSTADDGALRFWDAQDGRLLASLYVPERTDDWLLLTPDGRLDGSEPALRKHLAWRMGDRVARDARESSTRRTPGLWRTVAFSP